MLSKALEFNYEALILLQNIINIPSDRTILPALFYMITLVEVISGELTNEGGKNIFLR